VLFNNLKERKKKGKKKKEHESLKELTLVRTSKFIPPPWYKGDRRGGGGLNGTPRRSFWYVAVF